ncbi:MAG: FkbM family methyltransferase [Clostridia bacterium]|nr:FkbM family methyltransferase [Clostridia bacterium]
MMNIEVKIDLWNYLQSTKKPILMYGMGNGADKILKVCDSYGIEISDFFASDGFVRGHSFHGKVVLSYSQAKEKYNDFIVLLSFASSLPDVLENIKKIAAETELYAPDVPVFGDNLFNMEFFTNHKNYFEKAYSLLEDERSKFVYENIINYKLSGKIDYLFACDDDEDAVTKELLKPCEIKNYADLGAYNGDTVRKLMMHTSTLEKVVAFEPDRRNFRKLSEWAESVEVPQIFPYKLGAWSHKDKLFFDASGNRNANIVDDGKKATETDVDALDNIVGNAYPDYIKYDVEGSEYEALMGTRNTIANHSPKLLVSVYHRSEDLYKLPLLVKELNADYRLYLRKLRYIPAWDLNLYALKG